MRAVVVALGDLGRSARMLYHAHALAANGVDVDLVGFEGTPLPNAIAKEPRLVVHRMKAPTLRQRGGFTGIGYVIAGLFDATRLSVRLWRTLRQLRRPELVLIQNPPAFPTLAVTWFSLRAHGVRFVIDWHNLGYTLLRLRLGRRHPAVRLARWFERRDARRVDANLCVSRGLAAFLQSRFGVQNARVLYDRPASAFTPMERSEREQFRQALFTRLGVHRRHGGVHRLPDELDGRRGLRPGDRRRAAHRGADSRMGSGDRRPRFPDIVILVTGDGARRAEFERRFAGLPARRIQLRARWLEPDDYPRVVGSADLGLCLHRSSSGLDIPMKVADLFGAGVPVCALDYGACLAERVRHGENGLLFSTARQLAEVLFDLFETFPGEQKLLDRLRAGARKSARPTWEEGWAREAKPAPAALTGG